MPSHERITDAVIETHLARPTRVVQNKKIVYESDPLSQEDPDSPSQQILRFHLRRWGVLKPMNKG